MLYSARTDLALEAREIYMEASDIEDEIDGVEAEISNPFENTVVTRVKIVSDKGEKALNKPMGSYVTIDFPIELYENSEVYENICRLLASELNQLLNTTGNETVLVAGLGNRFVTPDSLGPNVVDSIVVTRHIFEYISEDDKRKLSPICAIAPGVLGITGIETAEIIHGICEEVKPSAMIAVDALCSRNMKRINSTIQISDSGITPGAGIGNQRMALNERELGIPVIAIGVPTVIDATTITADSIDFILKLLKDTAEQKEPLYKALSDLSETDKHNLIKRAISENIGDFIVTPKDIDGVIKKISAVIADGINLSLHKGIKNLSDLDVFRLC